MGCVGSKEARFDDLRQTPLGTDDKHQQQPQQRAELRPSKGVLKRTFSKEKKKKGTTEENPSVETSGVSKRRVSFAGNVANVESSRPSRMVQQRSTSFVGADLHAIMDEHGMLNPLVSRQLSVMSHYSVRSESGSVMITPEQAKAPFELIKLIGRGGFGNVYLGDWDGEKVAVKVIAGNNSPDLLPEEVEWEARKERMAQMEAVLMSAIHHPNIVNTYKVTSHSGDDVDADLLLVERRLLANAGGDPESGIPSFEWHILMEYCDKGSLSKMLASFKLHTPLDSQHVGWHAWTALEVLKETVDAIMFLHEHRIIHGDLKAANILLSSSDKDSRGWEAKVSDFGLSRVIAANCPVIKTHTFGTVTHMPPELLSKGRLLPSSDVYAFGVLMWEIYTGEKVFKQLSDSEVILAVVTKKARPIFPPDCPSRYRFLAEKCWAEMHELRPSLKHVSQELNRLQEQLCPNGPDSAHIPCRVFPTRQRMMEQCRQQLVMQQAAAHAHVAAAHSPTSLVNGSSGNGHSTVTRQPPRPGGVVPLNHQQEGAQQVTRVQSQLIDKNKHKDLRDPKDPSIHTHSATELHKVTHSTTSTTPGKQDSEHALYHPQRSNKSFGAALTKSPLGTLGGGVQLYERTKSMHDKHPKLEDMGLTHATSPHPKGAGSAGQMQDMAAASAANMPLHPSLVNGARAREAVGSAPKRPSALKPSPSKRKHAPSAHLKDAQPSPSQVRFEV